MCRALANEAQHQDKMRFNAILSAVMPRFNVANVTYPSTFRINQYGKE